MSWLELRIPPVLLALLVGVLMWPVRTIAPVDLEFTFAAAVAIAGVGVAMAVAGVLEFRRAQTTVDPTDPSRSSSVVSSGIYRYTRNPMYLGFAAVLLGWAVYLSSVGALLGPGAFAIYMTRFQIIPEERILSARFGKRYEEYLLQVRRWI